MFTAAYSFVFLDGLRWLTGAEGTCEAGDVLVVEASFGDQLCYRGLSTLEAGLWARAGPRLLSVVSTAGGTSGTGPLTPSDSFWLWAC